MTALIIEDELPLRRLLKNLLSMYCPDIEMVSEAKNIKEGLKEIQQKNPQLIFLDIQLPDGNGFDLIQSALKFNYKFCDEHCLIFTTAYDQFAMKAFKVNALDYLLKPIDPEELQIAVERARKLVENNRIREKRDEIMDAISRHSSGMKKLAISTQNQLHWIEIEDIVRCESDDNYTKFFMVNGDKILVSKTLKEFDEQLKGFEFIRVHRSHLINLKFMKSYIKSDGGYVVMNDGTKISVSLRKKEALLSRLKNY